MKSLPAHAADLVRELDASHPARCINANEELVAAHRYAAKRELIDYLVRRLNVVESKDPTKPLLGGRDVSI